jgi:hypothetical protein
MDLVHSTYQDGHASRRLLAVGLLRLDGPVLLVDEELARLVALRQFLGVRHRLSLALVDARRSAGPLDLYFPPSVGVCRYEVGFPLADPLGGPSLGLLSSH